MFFALLSFSTLSSETSLPGEITIAVNKIEGLLEIGKVDAPYTRVMNTIKQRVPTKINFLYQPAIRAAATLERGEALCLFPSSLQSRAGDENKIESLAVNTAKAYFLGVTPINANQLLDAESPPLIIGYRRGNTYGGKIKKLSHHTLLPINTDLQGAKMLDRGRIEILLAYMPDSIELLSYNSDLPLVYDTESLFYQQDDRFLCHNSASGQALVQTLNAVIEDMQKTGELRALLGQAYVEP